MQENQDQDKDKQEKEAEKEEARDKVGMAPDSASEKKKQETTPEKAAQHPDADEKPDPEVP